MSLESATLEMFVLVGCAHSIFNTQFWKMSQLSINMGFGSRLYLIAKEKGMENRREHVGKMP